MPDTGSRPIIDCKEVARRLGVSPRAVAVRAWRRVLPGAFKTGRIWKIDEATFEAWRRGLGDPNAKPATAFSVDPLPFGDAAEKGEGDAA